jgi:hypothetical protein
MVKMKIGKYIDIIEEVVKYHKEKGDEKDKKRRNLGKLKGKNC